MAAEVSTALNVLAIETSGVLGSVALLRATPAAAMAVETIIERQTTAGERTAQSLVPTIHDALHEVGWRARDLELICVTSGPGSFTGLRIGVVTAKTLAYATGAALVGVHTLAAIAAGLEGAAGNLWTILDAQRQELFAARFKGGLVDDQNPQTSIVHIEQFIDELSPGDIVAGPPLAKLRSQLPSHVTIVDERFWDPTAAATGRLGMGLLQRGATVSPLELVPHYFRRSAAEEKALREDAS
jgi:tRNA threonylcarbamoyladenosine biosynthesis protein TsaB